MTRTPALMIQGTGSDVGKSTLVAGLCRLFANRGLRVMPFKPQNMSNNAAVTADGGEIGRAQALQARAARVPATVHMNPVLLKPQSQVGSQVIVQGRRIGEAKASDYQRLKPTLLPAVLDSFAQVSAGADFVLIEGAGSASEINLRQGDIANMGFAEAAGVPVVLVGDIDRGGVIASLVGTQAVLPPGDAARIKGFIVNRFRGDPALFASGMTAIADRTGWAALGLVPHFPAAHRLPAEDALALSRARPIAPRTSGPNGRDAGRVRIAVLAYPQMSNFDDFDPLLQEPGVDLVFLKDGRPLPGDVDLVILPGSKTTIADLRRLRGWGWDTDLLAHVRRGGRVLGICGGYQMLGARVDDPDGIEGDERSIAGLGLLPVTTILTGAKTLLPVQGQHAEAGAPFTGYEMHIGRTTAADGAPLRPLLRLADGTADGAVSPDGRLAGCYVHGLFAHDGQRRHWLTTLGAAAADFAYEAEIDATLDALAAHMGLHLDVDALLRLARGA